MVAGSLPPRRLHRSTQIKMRIKQLVGIAIFFECFELVPINYCKKHSFSMMIRLSSCKIFWNDGQLCRLADCHVFDLPQCSC